MKCLNKYKWVKLPRNEIPKLKGSLGYWLRLAERAAFRKGTATYCGHKNPVDPGMWSGGIVGLKKIMGVRSREQALQVLDALQDMGYISYTLEDTKQLTYQITDWIVECSGAECMDGAVYTTPGYGFLCMPRNITERLAAQGRKFEEADAWLDLWCHTVFRDKTNAFSFLSPVIQYGEYGSMLTLEKLGKRWGWEKTKVWRFFQKFAPYFQLYRLPGSYGCVIYSPFYPVCDEIELPEEETVMANAEFLIRNTRELILSQKTPTGEEDVQRIIDTTYPVEIGFNADGWFGVRIPLLIPKKDNYSVKYLEKRLGPVLEDFWRYRPHFQLAPHDSVIVFRHIYSTHRPGWERCVPADSEIDCVIRLFFSHVFRKIFPIDFRHYHCCAYGEEECTEVYVMPATDLGKWLSQETSIRSILPKGEKLYETIAAAREVQNEGVSKELAVMQ